MSWSSMAGLLGLKVPVDFVPTALVIQHVPRVGGFIWSVTEVPTLPRSATADPAGRSQQLKRWFAVGAGFEWMYGDLSRVARRPLTSALIPLRQIFLGPCAQAGPRGSCPQRHDLP